MDVESKILFLEIHSSTNLFIASLVQPELGKTAGSYPGITFFFCASFYNRNITLQNEIVPS